MKHMSIFTFIPLYFETLGFVRRSRLKRINFKPKP